MRVGITLPSRTGEMTAVFDKARRAELSGMDSVFVYEVYRNPFVLASGSALSTDRVTIGTGLAQGFSRSPFVSANAAADVDELSGGRFLYGVGTGVPEWLKAFHSTDAEVKPMKRLGEYIEVLRRSWEYLGTGKAKGFEGEFYRFDPPPVNPWGNREMARETIPIAVAAMGPKLLELCGRVADAWVGYFVTPQFIDEFVRPKIELGAAQANRNASAIEVVSEVICVAHPDREVAMARARKQVGFYAVHPVSDKVAALHGLESEVSELRGRVRREGFAAFEHTSDRLVDVLSITGTPTEVRQKIATYEGSVDHLVLHTPYVPPFTAEESEDCFQHILEAAGKQHVAGA